MQLHALERLLVVASLQGQLLCEVWGQERLHDDPDIPVQVGRCHGTPSTELINLRVGDTENVILALG